MAQALPADQLDLIAEAFENDGYVIIRGALSAEEMAPVVEQWNRVRDALRAGETIDGMRRDNFYIHGKLPGPSGEVFRHPAVTSVAQRLLGPDVALYLNRLNVKDNAFTDLIHLHQDIPYFSGRVNKINFFVALQDINLNNGAMVYIPGSHHLGILDRSTLDIGAHPELEVLIPSLQPGDLVIADIRLWHSSVPNILGTDRVLLQMIFQPANDGSYYPLSVPEPQLVTGQWKTDNFTPWQLLTATSPSQLIMDDEVADSAPTKKAEAMAAPVSDNASSSMGGPRVMPPRFLARVKAIVPTWVKQPIRDFVAKKK
jgi:Phytanoyl-CoA dioxygenase (PhyH)